MSRLGLVGGSYTSQSRNADDQLCQNLYPEVVESGSGKNASVLYHTPGEEIFVTLPDSPVRGEFYTSARAFVVAGSSFFEIFSNGTYVKYGMLVNDDQVVSMAAGPTQLLIASAGIAYVFNFATGVITATTFNTGGASGVASSSLNSGGAGYSSGDSFLIQTGNGNAAGVVDTVASGVVVTYHLTSVGSGYLATGSVSTIPVTGGGSGLLIDILTVGGGYAVGDTGTVNGGSVAGTYHVYSVDANGNVLLYSALGGAGYSVTTNQTTSVGGAQPGIGVGFTVNITAVGASNTFTTLPDSTLQNVSKVGFCDGFFLATLEGSDTFLASNLEDATTWNPLSQATVSVYVDNVLSMWVDHRNVWLFGIKKTVIYYDSGNFPFPFDLVPGGFIEQGIVAANSPVSMDNSVFWLGGDERGSGIAWRANGYTPVRVSTHATEFAWQSYPTIADAVGYSYQDQGHSFWVLYFPTANKTWVYDAATSLWHERSFRNEAAGIDTAHRSQNHIFAFGKHLVGDWESGNIYEMSISILKDNGNLIVRKRRAPHVSTEQEWIFHHKLQLDMETGLGPMPPLSLSSNSRASIVLADSGNNLWNVTMLDSGPLQQKPLASGTPTVWFMNDSILTNTSWQIIVTTLGILDQVSTAYNAAYPTVIDFATTPSALQSTIIVLSGILQTTPPPYAIARDPVINLRWSDDGGHTWSNYYPVEVGQTGAFKKRAIWRRLGRSRDRVYELSMSDPIPWRLLEEDLQASPGFQTSERIVSQYRKVS